MRISPEIGEVLAISDTPITVTLEASLGAGGPRKVFRGVTGSGQEIVVAWHKPNDLSDRARQAAAALITLGRPHPAFAWPIAIVTSEQVAGWGLIYPLVPGQFKSLWHLLADPVQPSLRVLARIGAELADAYLALHIEGLTYRDFNLAVPLADAETGEVIIPVTDGIGLLGDPHWHGTTTFEAPEVIRGDALNSAVTDLHTLAVVLFYLLVHGHPLIGRQAMELDDLGDPGQSAYLGTAPLFVFDPDDASNAPPPGDPMMTWWSIYPVFLRDLFTRAFTTGLTEPTYSGRVVEKQWHRALIRLASGISECSCKACVVWDPDEPGKACWNCGSVPDVPALLHLPGYTIALTEGAVIHPGHVSEGPDFRTTYAIVERHPAEADQIVLRNRSDATWKCTPEGETKAKQVRPGQRFGIRAAAIDFGSAQATIAGRVAADRAAAED